MHTDLVNACSTQLQKYKHFSFSRLKMAATVTTGEFGTIYNYSSLGKYSEACLKFLKTLKLIENYEHCEILV